MDDRRIVSAIVFVIKNGLRWCDAPRDYGPHKTIYNRFVRWSRLGVLNRFSPNWRARAANRSDHDRRHASQGAPHSRKPLKKGLFPDVSGAPKAA